MHKINRTQGIQSMAIYTQETLSYKIMTQIKRHLQISKATTIFKWIMIVPVSQYWTNQKRNKFTMLKDGMMMVEENNSVFKREFIALIYIFNHSTSIRANCKKHPGYQPVIHCNGIRQSAEVMKINGEQNIWIIKPA